MHSPTADDMDRADRIVQWSIMTGRNVFDTAGIDSSDEEWIEEHPQWEDYIESEIIAHKIRQKEKAKAEAEAKAKAKPMKKTMKKVKHKYPYPERFLKKDGSLKNSNRKQRNQWIRDYEEGIAESVREDVDPFNDPEEQENWLECHDCGKPIYLGEHSDFVGEDYWPEKIDGKWKCPNCSKEPDPEIEDIDDRFKWRSQDLHPEFDDQLIDEYVFDNKGRILTHESCKKLRDYCELNPRKCYLEIEFLERYVKICQLIAKTSLYIDAFYERLPEPGVITVTDPFRHGHTYKKEPLEIYARHGQENAPAWRNTSSYSDEMLLDSNPYNQAMIDRLINLHIPKSQMPQDAKFILINIIGQMPKLSGGIPLETDYGRSLTAMAAEPWRRRFSHLAQVYKHGITDLVYNLAKDPQLMEELVQRWREGMATQTDRKPKQIEEIIRRFIKNL